MPALRIGEDMLNYIRRLFKRPKPKQDDHSGRPYIKDRVCKFINGVTKAEKEALLK